MLFVRSGAQEDEGRVRIEEWTEGTTCAICGLAATGRDSLQWASELPFFASLSLCVLPTTSKATPGLAVRFSFSLERAAQLTRGDRAIRHWRCAPMHPAPCGAAALLRSARRQREARSEARPSPAALPQPRRSIDSRSIDSQSCSIEPTRSVPQQQPEPCTSAPGHGRSRRPASGRHRAPASPAAVSAPLLPPAPLDVPLAMPAVQRLDSVDARVIALLQQAADAADASAGSPSCAQASGAKPQRPQPTSPLAQQLAALRRSVNRGAKAAASAAGPDGSSAAAAPAVHVQGQLPPPPPPEQQQQQLATPTAQAAAELLEHCRLGRWAHRLHRSCSPVKGSGRGGGAPCVATAAGLPPVTLPHSF